MQNISVEKILKINIPPEIDRYSTPRVLWITARDVSLTSKLTFSNHTHTFYEIHIVTRGNIRYAVKGNEVLISSGELLMLKPQCPHAVLGFSDDFALVSLAFECDDDFPAELPNSFIKAQISSQITENIRYISSNHAFGQFSDEILRSRLRETVLIATDEFFEFKNKKKDEYDVRVYRAKKYIDDNKKIFFSCDEIAEFSCLSAKHLSRLFIKYEGVSLIDYLKNKKIDDAKELLLKTSMTQECISVELGFASVHYFNKFFKKNVGLTPGKYRKNNNCFLQKSDILL